jgi:hypothetical protein
VQKWVNECLVEGYAVESVHGWFSCFRTMMRDAVHRLALSHDCTQRISFPELCEREERGENALTPVNGSVSPSNSAGRRRSAG